MTQKLFILSVSKDLLAESEPHHDLHIPVGVSRDSDDSDLVSPAAKVTPPADRFVCRKEHMVSIARSKKYK